MPWRGAEVPGEFPTLGFAVADWIEANCAVPDGELMGQPYRLTDEMLWFLLHYYRLDPKTERFHYARGGQLVRPQKWGKGPFSATLICAEAEGPVLPAGWNADGEPVGKPWPTPTIQIAAVSEDQADNVWRCLQPMIELGALKADIPDTGQTRINLPGGGQILPVTASPRSRLGQRVTFAVQDETHSWLETNRGRALADVQRRNLAGMRGRWLETTNAWDPAEESVAQQTSESGEPGVYCDDVEPPPGSVRNKAERRKVMKTVYGDSWWVDPDRIDAEIQALLNRDPAQAERFFLNRKVASEGRAFDQAAWDRGAVSYEPEPGALIVLGIDGARFVDALAIVGTEVETGYQFVVGVWERPQAAGDDYEHPFNEVDGAVQDAFDRYDVWRAYIDPQYIDNLCDRWRGQHGEKVVIEWYTNRPRQTAFAVRNYAAAISAGDVSHDGDRTLSRHVKNAIRRKVNVYDDDHRQMWVIGKDRPDSPRKIDAAMAGVLSWEARGDAIAEGAQKRSSEVAFL